MKAAAFAALIALSVTTTVIDAASPAYARAACPVPASQAVDKAQDILRREDPTEFDIALACLTMALAQTRAELDDLREGRAAFTGQIHAPKGLVMTKPSVQEGR